MIPFSLSYLKKAFGRYVDRLGYAKIPQGVAGLMERPLLGFSNLGDTRAQLAAYQGHVYKCVTVIYRRAISVPLKLYKQRGEENEEVKRHPFLDLMKTPNKYMSGSDLKAITFMHRDLTGKAFWLKIFNGVGRPVEIWPLPVGNFEQLILNESETEVLGYEFKSHSGKRITYPAEQVVYFRYPHPIYFFDGASPIQAMAFSYDLDLAMKKYQRNFFQNAARPDIVFETDQDIQREDAMRLLLSWKQSHRGVDRAWEPAILDKGLKAHILSSSLEDLEFAKQARWTKEDILEAYNVPEGKLGNVRDVKYGSDLVLDATFNSECILPRLRSYDEQLNSSVVSHFDTGLFVKHANCVPKDKEYGLRQREKNLQNFVTTVNEEREKEGLKPVPWGHAPWIPRSMTQGERERN